MITSFRLSAAALLAAVAAFLSPAAAPAQTPGKSFRGAYDMIKPGDFNQQFVLFVGKNNFAYCIYADYTNHNVGFATFAISSTGQFNFTTNTGKNVAGTFTDTGVTGSATTYGPFTGDRQFFRTTGTQAAGCFNGKIYDSTNFFDSIAWIILPTGRSYTCIYNASGFIEGGAGNTTVDGASNGRGGTSNPFTFKSVLANSTQYSNTATLFEGSLTGSFTAPGNITLTFQMSRENTTYHLINIATRGFVNTGDGVMIAGFVISGGAKRVVVRALGPSLAAVGVAGVLSDPMLQINSGSSVLVTNDGWRTDAGAAQITALGLAPTSDLEAAVVLNLEPGAYTAIVSGAGNATGVAIVEVYEID